MAARRLAAGAMTRGRAPEWTSAQAKRVAWTLGLAMALAMAVIADGAIRGPLPRTMCLTCLTLMWLAAAVGVCVGCPLYALLAGRGWTRGTALVCADGACGAAMRGAGR